MVAGVANKQDGKGDVICGQVEDKGPWVAEGHVEEVCKGAHCFVVLCQKLYIKVQLGMLK